MTVIAWRAPFLAADRRVVYGGDARQGPMCKLALGETAHHRFAIAAAGDSESDDTALTLARAILATRKRPAFKGELSLLIVARAKNARALDRVMVFDAERTASSLAVYTAPNLPAYLAIGVGAPYALGAMHTNAHATQAVRAANAHCTLCGDGLDYVDTSKPFDRWRIRAGRG